MIAWLTGRRWSTSAPPRPVRPDRVTEALRRHQQRVVSDLNGVLTPNERRDLARLMNDARLLDQPR